MRSMINQNFRRKTVGRISVELVARWLFMGDFFCSPKTIELIALLSPLVKGNENRRELEVKVWVEGKYPNLRCRGLDVIRQQHNTVHTRIREHNLYNL